MAGHIQSAGNVDWNTPEYILERVRNVFGQSVGGNPIKLDPCSNGSSLVKAEVEYILPHNDGLVDSWNYPTVYVNPPFGKCYMHLQTKDILSAKEFQKLKKETPEKVREYRGSSISDWVKLCDFEGRRNHEVIALLPAAVGTKYWHDIIFPSAQAVCFLKGRVKFKAEGTTSKNVAPMDCAIVYWGYNVYGFESEFDNLGYVVLLNIDFLD